VSGSLVIVAKRFDDNLRIYDRLSEGEVNAIYVEHDYSRIMVTKLIPWFDIDKNPLVIVRTTHFIAIINIKTNKIY
jgi:hypothetical protein